MISLKAFNEITATKRRDMAKRCKPRYWKSGKRAGRLRAPGRELPFTLEDFRAWVKEKLGLGVSRCYYCPRPIDVLSFEPDHYEPLELGGGLGLENLVPACEDCNRLKGAMPPDDFKALIDFVDTKLSRAGRADVLKRLRSGSMGIRLRHQPKKQGDAVPPQTATSQSQTQMGFDEPENF